jgi:hypothetical protein
VPCRHPEERGGSEECRQGAEAVLQGKSGEKEDGADEGSRKGRQKILVYVHSSELFPEPPD